MTRPRLDDDPGDSSSVEAAAEGVRAKADEQFWAALRAAPPDREMTAIMVLQRPSGGALAPPAEVSRQQYPDRGAYKRAVQAQMKARSATEVGSVIDDLARAGLSPTGGEVSPVVIVRGRPAQLVRGLEHPGVRSAMLDRELQLHEHDHEKA
jgi:hypothetical protein